MSDLPMQVLNVTNLKVGVAVALVRGETLDQRRRRMVAAVDVVMYGLRLQVLDEVKRQLVESGWKL